MPYLNLDLDWFTHRKAIRLVGLLGVGAEIYPIKVWAYCGKYHPEDGRLEGYSVAEIEAIAGWRGTPGMLVDALTKPEIALLDAIENIFQVHDWVEHAGHLAAFKKRAKTAAKKRWRRYATSIAKSKTTNAPTLPTIPNQTKPNQPPEDNGFVIFWKAYPRKVNKELAEKAWKKSGGFLQTILAALEIQKSSDQWQRDDGKYIPYPATWLNNKRWQDEIAQAKKDEGPYLTPLDKLRLRRAGKIT